MRRTGRVQVAICDRCTWGDHIPDWAMKDRLTNVHKRFQLERANTERTKRVALAFARGLSKYAPHNWSEGFLTFVDASDFA